jgi:uncharacterized membrane-anchored protein
MKKLLLLLALTPLLTLSAQQNDAVDVMAQLKELEAKLEYKTGEVTLKGNLAKLKVPENFRYLGPKDANIVLSQMWGNPEGDDTLGMLMPTEFGPLDEDGWAVVITYTDDGHVKDSDADKIDYSDLLKDMQKDTREYNAERKKEGYPTIELVGWAAPPHYDKATHKMYWAKELKFDDGEENTLNYNIRVLGRRGVLVLNAVSSMSQFATIEKHTPEIVGMVEFTEGNRYADFNDKTDKVAAYGLAALVAGGVASKAGFFKVLWLGLLAGKKFVIIGLIGLVALAKKIFGNKDAA